MQYISGPLVVCDMQYISGPPVVCDMQYISGPLLVCDMQYISGPPAVYNMKYIPELLAAATYNGATLIRNYKLTTGTNYFLGLFFLTCEK